MILAVLPLALLIRVIFFASAQSESSGRSPERAAREDGGPVPQRHLRPQDQTRADETRH